MQDTGTPKSTSRHRTRFNVNKNINEKAQASRTHLKAKHNAGG